VLAIVDRDQFKQCKAFDKFIDGKGQSMVMLMCGPPGIGKTLTAETMLKHLRRPLYKLGAGNLGTEARIVESNLDRALKLCGHFGAVILTDKAGVFMEARTSNK
jgi:Cdc6-like AAA superfamily ATPase